MVPEAVTRYFANIGNGDPLKGAFPARRAVMPFLGKRRLPPERIASEWKRLIADVATPRKRVAYIHVPFCANHCLFCGFYRNAYLQSAGSEYVDLVVEEIEREAAAPAFRSAPILAAYLGGGTPSALTAKELSRLLRVLRERLPFADDCEITVEGRVIHFDADKIDACLEAGANRFSIGVQSFDTDVRRRQGRRSSREQIIRFLEALRDRDRAAVIIDLMYGLPGQTLETWQRDLETAAAIQPDGIDLYGLNLIRGTPLASALEAGKFKHAPSLGDQGEYYRLGSAFLSDRSWRQVSNNHWARTPRERNAYNLLMKEGADCLAYGSGAGGSFGHYSYGIKGDLPLYSQGVRAGEKPIGMMVVADASQSLGHLVTAGLETGRLNLEALDRAAGREIALSFRPLLTQWQEAGLLAMTDTVVELTVAGRFWYGNLISALHEVMDAQLGPDRNAA